MAKLERTYNIPLRKGFLNTPKYKRAKRAIRLVREFLQKHMKCEDIKLGKELNENLWERGIKNPPHHIKVTAIKEDDVVKAELIGFEYKEAVKSQKKKEDGGLKEKIASKLGIKADEEETKEEDKKKESNTETQEEKKTEAKEEDAKKTEKPSSSGTKKPEVPETKKPEPKKDEAKSAEKK